MCKQMIMEKIIKLEFSKMQWNIEDMFMITIKQMRLISALNKLLGVDLPFNE